MTYCFELIEYTAKDGTTLQLNGTAECEVYHEKAEPQTREDPGCPAEVIVESIESVDIDTIALIVNGDYVGLLNVGEVEGWFLKQLETFIEKDQLEAAQAHAQNEDARDYEPEQEYSRD